MDISFHLVCKYRGTSLFARRKAAKNLGTSLFARRKAAKNLGTSLFARRKAGVPLNVKYAQSIFTYLK
jgi:hypothetical protein